MTGGLETRVREYYGRWASAPGLTERVRAAIMGLVVPGSHVWVRYARGMSASRGRCLRCGVTADWYGGRSGLPRRCEETRGFLAVHDVMGS